MTPDVGTGVKSVMVRLVAAIEAAVVLVVITIVVVV
jgi:hypothetical protein